MFFLCLFLAPANTFDVARLNAKRSRTSICASSLTSPITPRACGLYLYERPLNLIQQLMFRRGIPNPSLLIREYKTRSVILCQKFPWKLAGFSSQFPSTQPHLYYLGSFAEFFMVCVSYRRCVIVAVCYIAYLRELWPSLLGQIGTMEIVLIHHARH